MESGQKRTAINFDSKLYKSLKLKSIETSKSISSLVNQAVRESLAEDAEDIAVFEERTGEPMLDYSEILKRLKSMAGYEILCNDRQLFVFQIMLLRNLLGKFQA
jgi:hypothetical protein